MQQSSPASLHLMESVPSGLSYSATEYMSGLVHWTHYRALRPRRGAQTVVLVHGAGHDEDVYSIGPTNWVRFFTERGHDVVTLSLPGHGKSRGSVRFRTMQSYLRALRCFVGVLGLADEQLIYLGHSMGGALVQMLLARYPDIAGVVVLDCPAPHRCIDSYLGSFRRLLRRHPFVSLASTFNPGVLFSSDQLVRELLVGDDASPEVVTALRKHLGSETGVAMLEMMRIKRAGLQSLPGHKLLYVAAASSAFFPTSDTEASAREQHARFLLVPGPHNLMLTSSAPLALQAILSFIAALPSGGKQ